MDKIITPTQQNGNSSIIPRNISKIGIFETFSDENWHRSYVGTCNISWYTAHTPVKNSPAKGCIWTY